MPHATKKPSRPRLTAVVSTPVQYPQARTQPNQPSSTSASSSYSYSWTAADAAKASRDGAFLTPWPRDESYYAPPVHLLGQGYQGQAQSQGQGQNQGSREIQYYYPPTRKSSTAPDQGGSGGGK
ncbi:hypothetical protein F5Y13DRAFT_191443 [Hypoxylon sp. FL1857]|nr:hypothetical protein F5Y13DRAFT_191443 [Hypoxylon sp. FL1857]